MFEELKSLLSTKVRVRIVLRVNRAESLYALLNQLKSYGLPGFARAMPGNSVAIEMEGRESTLREKLKVIATSPHLSGNYSITPDWLPYTGKYQHFNISY
jgi:acylphosphatase